MEMDGRMSSHTTRARSESMGLSAEALRELESAYGISIAATVQRRTVIGLCAENGHCYMWKEVSQRESEERLADLREVLVALEGNHIRVAPPIANRFGRVRVYLPSANASGFLQPWLAGRHANYNDLQETVRVIKEVARMHRTLSADEWRNRRTLTRGHLRQRLQNKRRALEVIWRTAVVSYPSLATIEPVCRQRMDTVLAAYSTSLAQMSVWPMSFCHRDLAPHNVLLNTRGEVQLIDFDQAGLDDPLHDILQILNHVIFLHPLRPGELRELVDVYVESGQLSKARSRMLWRLLSWPENLGRSLVEWAKRGYSQEDLPRVSFAVQKEMARFRLLATDSPRLG